MEQITFHDFDASVAKDLGLLRVAYERTHASSSIKQCIEDMAADKARGAGYERDHTALSPLGSGPAMLTVISGRSHQYTSPIRSLPVIRTVDHIKLNASKALGGEARISDKRAASRVPRPETLIGKPSASNTTGTAPKADAPPRMGATSSPIATAARIMEK
jgi:hypothetical protein